MRHTTQLERDGMIKAYLSGLTMKKAAVAFGYTTGTCQYILKRNGDLARPLSKAMRRYKVNETFFDVIDTKAKAYWLGFLTADGNVRHNSTGNVISCNLQVSDANHLRKFQKAIQSEHPVKTTDQVRIVIGSIHIVQTLAVHGVHPRKSKTVKPCTHIPNHLLNHYWRGVWDGDGSIYQRRDGQWAVCLVGNNAIVSGFAEYIKWFVNSRARVVKHENSWLIRFSGTLISQEVGKVLYQNATLSTWLDRKRERTEQCWATKTQKSKRLG